MHSDLAIKIEGLSKTYKLYANPKDRLKEALHPFGRNYHKDFDALKNVSAEIKKGEVLGIIGKNGAGKSTLLKIIVGLSQATSGSIKVNGKISALLSLGAGFNPEFTGIDNIYFYGAFVGFSNKQMDERIDAILSFADIGDFVYQPLKHYSSGMIARLGFAVAIHIDPEILIVDEVLAVGDELFRRKCYARIERFMEESKTILFVTHSVQTINQLCTRVLLLDQGELILEGPAQFVTNQYEKFLYSKQEDMNRIRNDIIVLNGNGKLKETLIAETSGRQKLSKETGSDKVNYSGGQEVEQSGHSADMPPGKKGRSSFYIPDLMPKSKLEYKNHDVHIHDVKITSPDGKQCNALVVGEEYIYSYKVKFDITAEKVNFGMKFKTEKGIEIEGASEPAPRGEKKYILRVKKGENYLIEWYFKCLFVPGLYYTNAGVTGTVSGEEGFLHRIVDSAVFKVLDVPDRNYVGIVHVCQKTVVTTLAHDEKDIRFEEMMPFSGDLRNG